MSIEQTLSIIKPDAVRRNLTGKILSKFEEQGLSIVAQKKIKLSYFKAIFRKLKCDLFFNKVIKTVKKCQSISLFISFYLLQMTSIRVTWIGK